ncbi:class I SAM-dependent methyltransferase [Paucisalibacillus globulus]|uniref:class I SAM-dependent methyltransferase n=1 Tax=Paucisalibacillus globulus TaxID=351095 RepID=UPI001FE0386F|nr:class I SAM-dependent methyltransferase [Paucisalibacillus globulus]
MRNLPYKNTNKILIQEKIKLDFGIQKVRWEDIMIITTPGKSTSKIVGRAKKLANSYGLPYKERHGVSIQTMKNEYRDDIVIVENNRIVISPLNSEKEMFYHPNLALIRAKRIMNEGKGGQEPLISIAKLKEGMSFLDCTLGLASDSIIASLIVGPTGKVTGIEGNQLLYFLTHVGLATFTSGIEGFDAALRRIDVIHQEHLNYLRECKTDSFDVVYLDPMFNKSIDTSDGINIIREEAWRTDFSDELIQEAKRVARARVVLKDDWKSTRFARFGFTQYKRKSSSFHYGILEV